MTPSPNAKLNANLIPSPNPKTWETQALIVGVSIAMKELPAFDSAKAILKNWFKSVKNPEQVEG